MSSKRKNSNEDRKTYEAIIQDDGSRPAGGQSFSSPSYAAMYFIKKIGSARQTVNGWTSWRTEFGRFLPELREEFLKRNPGE